MSARRKVTVVGAGNVGATCAQVLATRDYADVVLVDIKEGLPQGKALDIAQMGAILGYEPSITGSNDYDATARSSVVVLTAGKVLVADFISRAFTVSGVSVGSAWIMSAAAPLTTGVAILVPLRRRYAGDKSLLK